MDFYVAGGMYPAEAQSIKDKRMAGLERFMLLCDSDGELIVRPNGDDVIQLIDYFSEVGANVYKVSEDRRKVTLACVGNAGPVCQPIEKAKLSGWQIVHVMEKIESICKNNLIDFYFDKVPNNDGHKLSDIMEFDDKQLERLHHYIQWIFPLREVSPHNPIAPTLDEETISRFRKSREIHIRLYACFLKMSAFYGISSPTSGCAFIDNEKNRHWLSPKNHNYKRLTRMLTSMRLLGLEDEAMMLFKTLRDIMMEYHEVIGWETFFYWEDAMLAKL